VRFLGEVMPSLVRWNNADKRLHTFARNLAATIFTCSRVHFYTARYDEQVK
jgi:hypothetical protein